MRGFYCVDKPAGMTSSDVVVKIRGILKRFTGERLKVGHLGTLDPMATGVLVVAVGTATRLFDYLSEREKRYLATFKFGCETDTLDSEGKILTENGRIPTAEEVSVAASELLGEYAQIPPAYSAKSIGGRRAYDLARKGIQPELAPRTVKIYGIDVIGQNGEYFSTDIRCGGGTYIRAIGRDIAAKLNTFATMTALRRTSAVGGMFGLHNLVTLDGIQEDYLKGFISLETALTNEQAFDLPEEAAFKILNGIKLEFKLPDGDFVVRHGGRIIAIGEGADGYLHLKTRL